MDSLFSSSYRRLWGRKQSHPLSAAQKDLLKDFLPHWHYRSDDSSFFQTYPEIVLEIGFGDGEHLLEKAQKDPLKGFIGCEPFINGIVKVLSAIKEENLSNIRLFSDDVFKLFEDIPEACLNEIYVLFPDPWPKKRHKKRRLLSREFIKELYPKLKSQGRLFMASDDADYRDFIQEEMESLSDLYQWVEALLAPRTKYCRKAEKAGRTSAMFCYEKI